MKELGVQNKVNGLGKPGEMGKILATIISDVAHETKDGAAAADEALKPQMVAAEAEAELAKLPEVPMQENLFQSFEEKAVPVQPEPDHTKQWILCVAVIAVVVLAGVGTFLWFKK